ncbi:MAG: hypothetical protein Q3995_03605 [Eubacteriales bacterium]|nr:hypothetical protein [Eubacteriales bacterium]
MQQHTSLYQNALLVCVDQVSDTISGRVYSCNLHTPLSFSDAATLLLQVEGFLEQKNAPQSYTRIRRFTDAPESGKPEKTEGMPLESVTDQSGAVDSFWLHIVSRRNSNWQGYIEGRSDSFREAFSSEMELLRLLKKRYFA